MGTEFFWFYDIVVVAIIVGIVIKCARKGFLSTIAGLLALVIAFVAALPLSEVISGKIYETVVRDNLETKIEESLDGVLDGTVVGEIKKIDMSKARINGKNITEITLNPDISGKISLDLSSVDLSDTGMADTNLEAFGIKAEETDFSAMNFGAAQITKSDLEKYGLEKLVLANTLATKMSDGTVFGPICSIAESISTTLPQIMSGYGENVSGGDKSTLRSIVLSIITADTDNFAVSILDNAVKPIVLVPIRALIFIVLFVIIVILLNLLAKALRLVNKIPLIGTVNVILGFAAGIAESVIILFLVCIGIQVLINLTGNQLIFVNTDTIEKTFLFKYIYNFDFLNFLA